MKSCAALTAIGLLIVGIGAGPQRDPLQTKSNLDVIDEFVAAFNAHAPAEMMAFVSDDVRWMSVNGEKIAVETGDRESLQQAMTDYFRAMPTVQSATEEAVASGRFVSVRERVFWGPESARSSQAALAVYEFRGGKIHRVWYFPASR